MNVTARHLAILLGALAVGALAHQLVQAEAAALGLTVLELSLLSAAAGACLSRTTPLRAL